MTTDRNGTGSHNGNPRPSTVLFALTADEIGEVQRARVRDGVEMSNGKCVDYPACGHTDGLGCDWVSPNDNPALYFCGNPDHDYYGTYPWHAVGAGCPEEEYEEE